MADPSERLSGVLSPRYTLVREIGRGGMATVYLAEDVKHRRKVAIKVMRPALAAVLGSNRFLHEITVISKLTHPHILPLLDSGEAGGFLYYVMPYLDGQSLRDRLKDDKQLSIDTVLRITREVASALQHAHDRGIVHRDIKPENILFESGHAVVADFGVSKAVTSSGGDTLTEPGMAVGTPAYMSPEQAGGSNDVDGRSDVYALGCVVYEMLSGRPPFVGPTPENVIRQQLVADPPDISGLRANTSEAVNRSVQRALAKLPADRFATATQFAEAISLPDPVTDVPERDPAGFRSSRRQPDVQLPSHGALPVSKPRPVRSRLLLMGGIVTAGTLLIATVDVARRIRADSNADFPTVTVNPVVALGTDDANLSSVGEVYERAIINGLAQVQRVRVVMADEAETTPTLEVRVSFHEAEDSLQFGMEIVDHARNRTLPPPPAIRAPVSDPARAVNVVRRAVMGAVAYYTDAWHPRNPTRHPPTWEAYTTFQSAMYNAMFRWTEPDAMAIADSMFRQVLEFDSLYSEAYFWLAAMFSGQYSATAFERAGFPQRGLHDRMDSLNQSMRRHIRPLTDLDRAIVEFGELMVAGSYAEAARWARELERLLPSKPNLALLAVSSNANRPWVALDQPSTTDYADWYFDYHLSWFHVTSIFHQARDYLGEADAVDSAKARGRSAWFGVEARAHAALGNVDRVRSLTQNLNAFDAHAIGFEVRAHALELNDPELLAESDRILRMGLEWYDEAPHLIPRQAWGYWFLTRFGRIDEIIANMEALTMTKDSVRVDVPWGMLGVAYARQGNVVAAEAIDRWLTNVNGSGLRGLHTLWRARIAAQLDKKDQAVDLLERAFDEGVWFSPLFPGDGSFWHSDPDFESLRDYPSYQQLIAPKR